MAIALSAALLACAAFLLIAPAKAPAPELGDTALAPVPSLDASSGADISAAAGAILSRPLFSKGRRAAAGPAGENSSLGEFRLAGAIANRRVSKALFVPTNQSGDAGKGRWVAVGEEIAGWRVQTIEAGRVNLSRGAESTTLSISKRRALTPKQAAQARAATPIRTTGVKPTAEAIEARINAFKESLAKSGQDDLFAKPD
jgi:hypothetical protein